MIDINLTDEWGGIDSKMKNAVYILNLLDLPTTGSCEGHIDHGSPAPWIMIQKTDEANKNEKIYQKLAFLLKEFYKNRSASPDTRIIIKRGNAGFWLHNGGKAYAQWRKKVNKRVIKKQQGDTVQEFINEKEKRSRTKHLLRFQKEMKMFTKFLENKLPTRD